MEEGIIIDKIFDIRNCFGLPQNVVGEYSPLALAFVGDSIFEVYVRTYILSKGNMPPHKLHILSSNFVRAKSQAKVMLEITQYLTEDEQNIAKRGRNSNPHTVPKNADITDYRNATGFESLLGYLFLTGNNSRIKEILEISIKIIEN